MFGVIISETGTHFKWYIDFFRKNCDFVKTNCYLYTVSVVKSTSFLEEKFFTRCRVQEKREKGGNLKM